MKEFDLRLQNNFFPIFNVRGKIKMTNLQYDNKSRWPNKFTYFLNNK